MNVDPAGELAKLIDAAIQKRLSTLHVAFPCSVISFDKVKRTATVQPILGQSPIQNVRVSAQKIQVGEDRSEIQKPLLEQGDIVYVVCSDHDLKGTSKRMHDKNDAVVVGVFPCGL